MSLKKYNIPYLLVIVASLGYFVDIYDLILFQVVKADSLIALGYKTETELFEYGTRLFNFQMIGMLVGGLLWGIMGDKIGRVKVLFGSILLYSIANLGNAFVYDINTYSIARFIAGVGLAGELGAGITLISETMEKDKRGIGTMIIVSFGALGAVLAALLSKVLPWNILSNLLRFANISHFEEAKIGGGEENKTDFNVRRTYTLTLSNLNSSMSNVHWFNLLHNYFNKNLRQYKFDANILDYEYRNIFDIGILKYENTGFYTWHTDHFAAVPRTMSCILLLNNDYEGGNLCFRNPDGSGEWEVEVKPNRMIIWPSNFLYPHTVKPVTKGTRYSVVAWAL
jgi:hypothetical protein